ncbi:phage minor capsid protein [Corynebacterium sp. 13CS0277]|uniref:phage minor capsid protein n=1 Tax=Corynebacterium sp. 13CS0277 TaxID=2071994 RepID=UPI001304DA5F|nr:phage minor capsid protein [Corynebacterium sp. 13CS0277]
MDYEFAELLGAVYAAASVEITAALADAVRREAAGTAEYLGRQGVGVAALRRRVEGILREVQQGTGELTEEALGRAYVEAFWETSGGQLPQGFSHAGLVQTVREVREAVAEQHRAILRSVEGVYRRVVATTLAVSMPQAQTRVQVMQAALDRFADEGVDGFRDKLGRRWGIDSYAEMTVRTGMNRARNFGRVEGYRQRGVGLVLVSRHKGCSDLCLPFQGRLLAVSGPAGRRVVEDPATGAQVEVEAVATWDDALAAGYHHPNCRHTDSAYVPGMRVEPPAEQPEGEYEATQRQRYLERGVRRWKRREAAASTPSERAYARGKVRQWQGRVREHVAAHEGLLVRRYDRERLWRGRAGVRESLKGFEAEALKAMPPMPASPAVGQLAPWPERRAPQLTDATARALASVSAEGGAEGYYVRGIAARVYGVDGDELAARMAKAGAMGDAAEARALLEREFFELDVPTYDQAAHSVVLLGQLGVPEAQAQMLSILRDELGVPPAEFGQVLMRGGERAAKAFAELPDKAHIKHKKVRWDPDEMREALAWRDADFAFDDYAALSRVAGRGRIAVDDIRHPVSGRLEWEFTSGEKTPGRFTKAPMATFGANGENASWGQGHLVLTPTEAADHELRYIAQLRTAGYHGDHSEALEGWARRHRMPVDDAHFKVALMENDLYGVGGTPGSGLRDGAVAEARAELAARGRKTWDWNERRLVDDTGEFRRTLDETPVQWSDEKFARVFATRYQAEASRLPLEEYKATKTYTGPAYQDINGSERESHGTVHHEAAAGIDRAIEASPRLDRSVTVTRGTRGGQFATTCVDSPGRVFDAEADPQSIVGHDFIEYGYMSTSVSANPAMSKEITMVIEAPAGTKGIYLDAGKFGSTPVTDVPGEREFLLPRQTVFTVNRVEQNRGGIIAFCTVKEQRV